MFGLILGRPARPSQILCLGKFVPVQSKRRMEGVELYLHSSITSALDRASGQHHSPAPLFPGKKPRYSSNRMLGGSNSRSLRFGERLLTKSVFDG